MSVTKQIREQQKQENGRKNGHPKDQSGFPQWINLTLTQAEKEYLISQKAEWVDLETALEELLQKGCTLKLFKNDVLDCVEISLREKRSLWKEEKNVSLSAKTLMSAVIGLHYAISRHVPGWPTRNLETIEF